MGIRFWTENQQLRNGSKAKVEYYEFSTDEMIVNGAGLLVHKCQMKGRVDDGIRKEHAKEYADFRFGIDNPGGKKDE